MLKSGMDGMDWKSLNAPLIWAPLNGADNNHIRDFGWFSPAIKYMNKYVLDFFCRRQKSSLNFCFFFGKGVFINENLYSHWWNISKLTRTQSCKYANIIRNILKHLKLVLRSEKIDAWSKSDEVAIWVAPQSELRVKKRRKDEDVNSENAFRPQKMDPTCTGPKCLLPKEDS